MPEFKIRPIQLEEITKLVLLCAEHAAYERQDFNPIGKEKALEFAIFTAPPRVFVWVVELQHQLVGFASVTLDYSTWDAAEFAHLDCLYLQENARSHGLGQHLFNTVLEFATTRGCLNLQWQTPDWNEAAIRFYQRQGATTETKQRFVLTIKN